MRNARVLLIALLVLLLGATTFSETAQAAWPRIPKRIIGRLFKNECLKRGGYTDEEVAIWKNKLRYELHDLNGDSKPEIFLYIDHPDWCGAGFNCTFWVFQKSKGQYKLLVEDQVLRVMNTRTNGYRDVESQGRMGACILPDGSNGRHIYVTSYKYDGARYKPIVLGEQCRKLNF